MFNIFKQKKPDYSVQAAEIKIIGETAESLQILFDYIRANFPNGIISNRGKKLSCDEVIGMAEKNKTATTSAAGISDAVYKIKSRTSQQINNQL